MNKNLFGSTTLSIKFSAENAIKLLIIILMSFQLIDLTLKYREYKTIIKSEIKQFESGDLPSITLCRKDHDWRFRKKQRSGNKWRSELEYLSAYDCYNETEHYWKIVIAMNKMENYQVPWMNEDYYDSMTDIIIHNISSLKCVTIFSKLKIKSKNS